MANSYYSTHGSTEFEFCLPCGNCKKNCAKFLIVAGFGAF